MIVYVAYVTNFTILRKKGGKTISPNLNFKENRRKIFSMKKLKIFDSIVESQYDFEPEKFMRDVEGKLEISEKDLLHEREKKIVKKLNAGKYKLYICCEDGKFSFNFCLQNRNEEKLYDISKTLNRGDIYEEMFNVEEKIEPGIFNLVLSEKYHFWKRSKFEFSLICLKSFTEVKKIRRKIKCRIHVNGQIKWVHLSSTVKFLTLKKKFQQLYESDNSVLKYVDKYQQIATIDDQESLDVFIEESMESKEPPTLYYVKLGETIQFHSLNMVPSTPLVIQTPTSSNFSTFGGLTPISIGNSTVDQRDDSISEVVPGCWQLGGIIGKGGNATVYLGMNENNAKLMAVKEINIKGREFTEEQMKDLNNEIDLMKQLTHDNIVRYLGMEKKDDNLYIFVDYIPGGSLESILQEFSFTESLIHTHTKQILQGLKYLHDNKIIHRDIKCGNILLDENGKIFLADFGCSKKITTGIKKDKSIFGTPNYMAPEVIKDTNYTNKADIWSLGCTILEMIERRPPWTNIIMEFNDPIAFLFHMQKNIDKLEMQIPNTISDNMKDFLRKCFIKDYQKRPNVEELLVHPWIQSGNTANVKLERVDGNKEEKKEEEEYVDRNFDDLADIATYSDSEDEDLLPEEKEELKKLEKENFSDEKTNEKVKPPKHPHKKKGISKKFETIANLRQGSSESRKQLSKRDFIMFARRKVRENKKLTVHTVSINMK